MKRPSKDHLSHVQNLVIELKNAHDEINSLDGSKETWDRINEVHGKYDCIAGQLGMWTGTLLYALEIASGVAGARKAKAK